MSEEGAGGAEARRCSLSQVLPAPTMSPRRLSFPAHWPAALRVAVFGAQFR